MAIFYFSGSSVPSSLVIGRPSGPSWAAGATAVFSCIGAGLSFDLSWSLTGGFNVESLPALASVFFLSGSLPAVVGLPPFFFFLLF